MVGGVQVGVERAMNEEEGDNGDSYNCSYYDQHYGASCYTNDQHQYVVTSYKLYSSQRLRMQA